MNYFDLDFVQQPEFDSAFSAGMALADKLGKTQDYSDYTFDAKIYADKRKTAHIRRFGTVASQDAKEVHFFAKWGYLLGVASVLALAGDGDAKWLKARERVKATIAKALK